jgi:cold shock CspA family protein
MRQGTVKNWTTKGYGFLIPDDAPDTNVFAHISAVQDFEWDELIKGSRVSFEVLEQADGRTKATNIRILSEPKGLK